MTFAFQLSTAPESPDAVSVLALARAAMARGHSTRIFLMDDGVRVLAHPEWEALFRAGAEISVCDHSAGTRQVGRVDWAIFGSQLENAENLTEAQRWLAFN